MQYICLTIRYIAKQKRSKKQHLVAPKFTKNQLFMLIIGIIRGDVVPLFVELTAQSPKLTAQSKNEDEND